MVQFYHSAINFLACEKVFKNLKKTKRFVYFRVSVDFSFILSTGKVCVDVSTFSEQMLDLFIYTFS